MGNFIWPDWKPLPQDAPSPLPDPMVAREEKIANDTRVEEALNQFLTARRSTLFDAPDAFYRTQGEAAIHAAPVASKNLDQLRSDLLDGLGNDYQRQRLGNALDAQMQLTRDGMARHVAEQSLAWQRGVAQDRINILTKEAATHHNDTDLVDALGHAAATAARAHSRVGVGHPAAKPRTLLPRERAAASSAPRSRHGSTAVTPRARVRYSRSSIRNMQRRCRGRSTPPSASTRRRPMPVSSHLRPRPLRQKRSKRSATPPSSRPRPTMPKIPNSKRWPGTSSTSASTATWRMAG